MKEAACRRRNGDGRGSAASITTKEHRTMTQPPSSSEILNWFIHNRLEPSEIQELESYYPMPQPPLPTTPQLNDPFLSLKRRQMPVKGTGHKTTTAFTLTCDEKTITKIYALMCNSPATTDEGHAILAAIGTQLQELST